MNEEFKLEFVVRPAEKVKFRQEIHTYRCQDTELLLGQQGGTGTGSVCYPSVRLISRDGAFIPHTKIRLSLVDEQSLEGRTREHFHRLIDCRHNKTPSWHHTKVLENAMGITTFDGLGIVKTRKIDQIEEITGRVRQRREEIGQPVSSGWEETRIRDEAQHAKMQVDDTVLKLYIEAYVVENGCVQVLATLLSDPIQDFSNNNGAIKIKRISICSDSVRGGAEMMMFLGGPGDKVKVANHTFAAVFYELDDDKVDEKNNWSWHRIQPIPDDQLHTSGQHLAGVYFRVPAYDKNCPKNCFSDIRSPTLNTYVMLEKRRPNGTVFARSSRRSFQYTPSGTIPELTRKRARHSSILESQSIFTSAAAASAAVSGASAAGSNSASGQPAFSNQQTVGLPSPAMQHSSQPKQEEQDVIDNKFIIDLLKNIDPSPEISLQDLRTSPLPSSSPVQNFGALNIHSPNPTVYPGPVEPPSTVNATPQYEMHLMSPHHSMLSPQSGNFQPTPHTLTPHHSMLSPQFQPTPHTPTPHHSMLSPQPGNFQSPSHVNASSPLSQLPQFRTSPPSPQPGTLHAGQFVNSPYAGSTPTSPVPRASPFPAASSAITSNIRGFGDPVRRSSAETFYHQYGQNRNTALAQRSTSDVDHRSNNRATEDLNDLNDIMEYIRHAGTVSADGVHDIIKGRASGVDGIIIKRASVRTDGVLSNVEDYTENEIQSDTRRTTRSRDAKGSKGVQGDAMGYIEVTEVEDVVKNIKIEEEDVGEE